MRLSFFRLLTVLLLLFYQIQSKIQQQTTPQSLGLLVAAPIDEKTKLELQEFFKYYQGLKCQIIEQIIVVNMNERSAEQYKPKFDEKGITIYYYPQNFDKNIRKVAASDKFKIPKASKSSVYFRLNIKDKMICKELEKGFQIWKSLSYGSIGPLTGFSAAGYSFNNNGPTNKLKTFFSYTPNIKYYYSIILMERVFVSRHILDLFFINIPQIQALRKLADDSLICEDIVLNTIVSHFYPELKGTVLDPIIISKEENQSSLTKSNCLKNLTQILGYNPLVNYHIKNQGLNHWINPKNNQIVRAKKIILSQVIQNSSKLSDNTISTALQILSQQFDSDNGLIYQPKNEVVNKTSINQIFTDKQFLNNIIIAQVLLLFTLGYLFRRKVDKKDNNNYTEVQLAVD